MRSQEVPVWRSKDDLIAHTSSDFGKGAGAKGYLCSRIEQEVSASPTVIDTKGHRSRMVACCVACVGRDVLGVGVLRLPRSRRHYLQVSCLA